MKEIRTASANTLLKVELYIRDLENDIETLGKIEKIVGKTCLEFTLEKEYKSILRQQLIDTKKGLIDMINIAKQAERSCIESNK